MSLAIHAGRLITPAKEMTDVLVGVREGVVCAVEPFRDELAAQYDTLVDACDGIVAPGFIDIQVNGGLGHNVRTANDEERRAIYRYFLERGTTTLLPTVVTDAPDALERALRVIAGDVGDDDPDQPAIPGIHLEGPFLNTERRGAHPAEHLGVPDETLAHALCEAAGGRIAIVTLAPELEGAGCLVAWFAQQGAVVAAGHTTATSAVLLDACDRGLAMITHMGNVSDWPHRRLNAAGIMASEPGAVGAFMISDRLRASLILDGYHFHPQLAGPLVRLRGPESIALISDASYVTGCVPGQYDDGVIPTTVHRDGYAFATGGGGWLAGSIITLERAIQIAVEAGGISLREAIEMATLTPARILGIEDRKGRIAPGCAADLVVLKEDLTVTRVFRAGHEVAR